VTISVLVVPEVTEVLPVPSSSDHRGMPLDMCDYYPYAYLHLPDEE